MQKKKKKQSKKESLYIFLHIPKTGGGTFNQHLKRNLTKKEFARISEIESGKKEPEKVRVIAGHNTYYGIHKKFSKREPRYLVFIRDPAERFVSAYNHEMQRRERRGEKIVSFEKWYRNQIKNPTTLFLNRKLKGKRGIQADYPCWLMKTIKKFGVLSLARAAFKRIYQLKRLGEERFRGVNSGRKRLENAKNLLDKCFFVGITNKLDQDLPLIFENMGVPKKWKNEHVTTKSEVSDKDKETGEKVQKRYELDKEKKEEIYKKNKLDKKVYEYSRKLRKEKRENLM